MQELANLRAFIRVRLKARRMKYRDLAKKIGVSEMSVKRWLTSSDISLKKLVAIGRALDFKPFDLIEMDFASRKNFTFYTEAQEVFLAKSPTAFLIFIKLAFNRSLEEISSALALSRKHLLQELRALEKMKFLELWPDDKIQVKIRGIYRGQRNGPMMNRYHPKIARALCDHFLNGVRARIDDAIAPNCTLFRPTEMYLTRESAFKLSQDLVGVLARYARLSDLERTNRSEIEPVSILLGVDHYDVWTKVLSE